MSDTINLSLDLNAITGHAQDYMLQLGITYEHATPQSIADCWWFWNCRNVPTPLPEGLRVLTVTPSEAVGYGLARETANRLEGGTEAKRKKRQENRRKRAAKHFTDKEKGDE